MLKLRKFVPLFALAAAGLIGACGGDDAAGPDAVDPTALAADVEGVSDVFENNAAFSSLLYMGFKFPSFAAASAVRASLQMVGAPRWAGTLDRSRALLMRRETARLMLSISSPQALFPADVLGKTFVYDPNTDQYVQDPNRTGAPLNGVRFILYSVDSNGNPIVPLQELGHVDLTDESSPSADVLGVAVLLGSTTIADYSISAVTTTSTVSLSASGFVRNATGSQQVDFNLDNTFNTQTFAFSVDYFFEASDGTQLDVEVDITETETQLMLDIYIRVAHEGNSVELDGTLTFTQTSGTLNLEVRYNGVVVATITGDLENPTVTGQGGRQISGEEFSALFQIFERAGDFAFLFAEGILGPGYTVF
jgi:hypothetical protein